mgnify:CR=1 FL=1
MGTIRQSSINSGLTGVSQKYYLDYITYEVFTGSSLLPTRLTSHSGLSSNTRNTIIGCVIGGIAIVVFAFFYFRHLLRLRARERMVLFSTQVHVPLTEPNNPWHPSPPPYILPQSICQSLTGSSQQTTDWQPPTPVSPEAPPLWQQSNATENQREPSKQPEVEAFPMAPQAPIRRSFSPAPSPPPREPAPQFPQPQVVQAPAITPSNRTEPPESPEPPTRRTSAAQSAQPGPPEAERPRVEPGPPEPGMGPHPGARAAGDESMVTGAPPPYSE